MGDPARVVAKYLSRYAEAEHRLAAGLPDYDDIVVIPSYGEGELGVIFGSLRETEHRRLLVIVVVNEPPDAPSAMTRANRRTSAWCREQAELTNIDASVRHGSMGWADVLLVERTAETEPLPKEHGVGGARKIGCDLALALYSRRDLSQACIFTTDADARVPPDYFARARPGGASAYVFPYEHAPVGPGHEAITCYEIALRYYVLGLRHARSPYAFHTVGSCMGIEPVAYAQVRGVPNRCAAEDFYLLNKLRKLGPVIAPPGPPILLSGRGSTRVPFGTGRAVRGYADEGRTPESYPLYDPRSFEVVRLATRAATAWESTPSSLAEALSELGDVPLDGVLRCVESIGLPRAMATARASTRAAEGYRRHVETYFDAFRTLRLVHELRDHVWPDLPLDDALQRAPFTGAVPDELGAKLDHLRALERGVP